MKTGAFLVAASALAIFAAPAAPAAAGPLSGQYVEARTCDVWTGACFANAEMHLTGKNALMAWKFDKGQRDGVKLDGLSVVAVVEATDTLGLPQKGPGKAVLLVDSRATEAQRTALVAAAKQLGGLLTKNVVAVEALPITIKVKCCDGEGCAVVEAGKVARLETKCLHVDEDKACGHEDNFYPPLAHGVQAKSARVVDHRYSGTGLSQTWSDSYRRAAFVGQFTLSD
jgi:hypothetical protein